MPIPVNQNAITNNLADKGREVKPVQETERDAPSPSAPTGAMMLLKLLFLPYLGLGLFTGLPFSLARTGRGTWATKDTLRLCLAHLVLAAVAVLLVRLARTSQGTFRFGLSPGALLVGLAFAYLAGLGFALFGL